MPKFSERSWNNLKDCHTDLQHLFFEVVKDFDCTVIDGARTFEEQQENVRRGVSKTLRSLHLPPTAGAHAGVSLAADVAPYPIDWNDRERFYLFGGYVLGLAYSLDIPVRWGGDWDRDTQVKDQTFFDLVHFELVVTS